MDATACWISEKKGKFGELEFKVALLANDSVALVDVKKLFAARDVRITVLEECSANLNKSLVSMTTVVVICI